MSGLKMIALGGTLAVGTVVGTLGTTSSTQASICIADYEIQEGDTLLDIAHDQLGTVFAASLLIDENPRVVGRNPDLIFAGDRLSIPCDRAVGHAVDWSRMADVETLTGLLRNSEVQVLDIRSHAQVANGVIPGAIHLPFSVFETYGDPAAVRPAASDLSEIIGLSGVRLDQPIIIVGTAPTVGDLEQSAAIFQLLRSVGADHVAILKEGYRGWINAGLPVVAFPTLPDPYDVTLEYGDGGTAGKLDMLAVVATENRSSFWEDAAPAPDSPKFNFSEILFARFNGH